MTAASIPTCLPDNAALRSGRQRHSGADLFNALMPVPALSFATRYYKANAGIMITASHNPAKYNGYKAYGPDGCQMTDDAAAVVYAEIQKTDISHRRRR